MIFLFIKSNSFENIIPIKDRIKKVSDSLTNDTSEFISKPEVSWEHYIMSKKYLNQRNSLPSDGIVPDSITAIKLAEIVWYNNFGEIIFSSKPFIAKLNNKNIWRVTGTLKRGYSQFMPYAEIRKKDGKFITLFSER
jgi:hypothetical protein